MNYFIDPVLIYWIKVLDNISSVCESVWVLILAFVIFAVLFMSIGYFVAYDEYEKDKFIETIGKCKKYLIILGFIFVISLLLSIFIPDKETSIEMIIASKVTNEDVDASVDEIKSLIDYTVKEINEEK